MSKSLALGLLENIKYNGLKGLLRKAVCMALLFSTAVLYAQPIAVKAYTDKNKVLLGEPFWLTLEVKTIGAAKPDPFKMDSIPHFELIVKDSSKELHRGDTTLYHQYYQLRSFDSGRWVIPPFVLRRFVKTNSVLVDVVFTEDFDPKNPYHDVQQIKGVPFKMDERLEQWWYLIAGVLILLTLIIYGLTSPRKPISQRMDRSGETAYNRALGHLVDLKQSDPDEKHLYAQLVEIFRTYLLERTGITSLQQTSNNLVEKIRPLMKDELKYDSLVQVLYLCDFVKFAKYHPQNSEAASAFEVIEDSIHYIEQIVKRPPGAE